MHIHILGICGTLMGSIALLARQLGHRVTGSDENVYPPMSDLLESADIELQSGYDPRHLTPPPDLVILGNAGLARGNPAIEHLLSARLPFMSGAQWLGREVLATRWPIAVAGTHGKTTTTAMVAHILDHAGLAPGFLIAGAPLNFDQSARLGDSDFFVIEADEYDTSFFDRGAKFLHYYPRTLVIGNLEYDHADLYPDLAAIRTQFHRLLRTLPQDGLLVHPADDPNLHDLLQAGCWSQRLATSLLPANHSSTGQPPSATGLSARLLSADGRNFEVFLDARPQGAVSWSLLGTFNVRNALAAIGAARHAGILPAHAIEALARFRGVRRRLETLIERQDLTLYDDFAHHPTAISATLQALRTAIGDAATLIAIIDPASHTMARGALAAQLGPATAAADHAFWFRSPRLTWDIDTLDDSNPNNSKGRNRIADTLQHIESMLLDQIACATTPVHCVIMSNGNFGGLRERLTRRLNSDHG